jgi:hypothetical protein
MAADTMVVIALCRFKTWTIFVVHFTFSAHALHLFASLVVQSAPEFESRARKKRPGSGKRFKNKKSRFVSNDDMAHSSFGAPTTAVERGVQDTALWVHR